MFRLSGMGILYSLCHLTFKKIPEQQLGNQRNMVYCLFHHYDLGHLCHFL